MLNINFNNHFNLKVFKLRAITVEDRDVLDLLEFIFKVLYVLRSSKK